MDIGESEVQDQSQLCREFEARFGYLRQSQNNMKVGLNRDLSGGGVLRTLLLSGGHF